MAVSIPLADQPRQTFRIVLGGQSVRLTIWWQPLSGSWYLSVGFVGGAAIASGLRLSAQSNPLQGYVTDFRGGFTVEGDGDPARDAWATGSHDLVYLTPEEVAA